ncbi:signal peptidase I [Neisseriaceae bacterium ESL0693]|nr:signal peptidase I [Neisseriaceae bacterium ESL0693]
MSNTMVIFAIVALLAGIVLFIKSSKVREESGEWSGGLQWSYLLILVGVFILFSLKFSLTAVLLCFVLFSGVLWVMHKYILKTSANHVDNHHLTDYMSGFFPIILVVFVLRSFVAEPFQIPSSSMRPGLVVGDFILVNKYAYGLRLPILNNVLIPVGKVQRGDVVVFNYPENPKINYIKRVIGLPGDVVTYQHKVLSINGQEMTDTDEQLTYRYQERVPQLGMVPFTAQQFGENLGSKQIDILKMSDKPTLFSQGVRQAFPYKDQCTYFPDDTGFTCKVPAGHYFMMGDNRDNSEDSRYWGFVDDQLLVGKAFLVWLNLGDLKRTGTRIQ